MSTLRPAAVLLDGEDQVALGRVRQICAAFAHAEEAELQGRPLFRVGRRRFAIFNGNGSPPRPRWAGCGRSLHFVADPVDHEALGQDGRFAPSPHHAHRRWMFVALGADTDWAEVAELLDSAYRQVAPSAR